MALNYEVKKKVFGFDQTKTEKYVAQLKTLGIIPVSYTHLTLPTT